MSIELTEYTKITVGFVSQSFEKKDDKFVCTEQNFIAGDQVDREDVFGDNVIIDEEEEIYHCFDMVQSTKDWYILQMYELVDPQLSGPYNKDNAENIIEELRKEDIADKHSYTLLSVSKGADINF